MFPIDDLDGVAADNIPPCGRILFLVTLELAAIGPHEQVHHFDAAVAHDCVLVLFSSLIEDYAVMLMYWSTEVTEIPFFVVDFGVGQTR